MLTCDLLAVANLFVYISVLRAVYSCGYRERVKHILLKCILFIYSIVADDGQTELPGQHNSRLIKWFIVVQDDNEGNN